MRYFRSSPDDGIDIITQRIQAQITHSFGLVNQVRRVPTLNCMTYMKPPLFLVYQWRQRHRKVQRL